MKIKIITSTHVDGLQSLIDLFLESIGDIEIVSTSMYSSNMHDNYDDGRICNQWQEHTFTIVYK